MKVGAGLTSFFLLGRHIQAGISRWFLPIKVIDKEIKITHFKTSYSKRSKLLG